jgi:hypothetical protein
VSSTLRIFPERVTFLSAERCQREEDFYIYYEEGIRPLCSPYSRKTASNFEEKWNDLKIFIDYGMLTRDDFYEKAKDYFLFNDTDDKKFTLEEYKTLTKDNQTDKNGDVIYLYASNKEEQFSYIEAAKNKGYNVLLMNGQLDVALVSVCSSRSSRRRDSPVWTATSSTT